MAGGVYLLAAVLLGLKEVSKREGVSKYDCRRPDRLCHGISRPVLLRDPPHRQSGNKHILRRYRRLNNHLRTLKSYDRLIDSAMVLGPKRTAAVSVSSFLLSRPR